MSLLYCLISSGDCDCPHSECEQIARGQTLPLWELNKVMKH